MSTQLSEPPAVDIDHHVFSSERKCIFCEMTQNVAESEPRCRSRTLLRAIHRQLRRMQWCPSARVI
jgi:hypothetical protein